MKVDFQALATLNLAALQTSQDRDEWRADDAGYGEWWYQQQAELRQTILNSCPDLADDWPERLED